MVPPVVEASFEDDTPVERQVGDEDEVLGLPMVRTLGMSKSPGPSMLVEGLMLLMLAILMA